jgi:hypothetical protein
MVFEKNWIGGHNANRITTGFLTSPSHYGDLTLQSVARSSRELYSDIGVNWTSKLFFII